MSNTYGATVDFLNVSFRGDEFGRIAERPAEDFAHTLFSLLREQVQSLTFRERNGVYNYTRAWSLNRGALESDKPIMAGMIAFTPEKEHQLGWTNSGLLMSLSGAGCHGIDFKSFIQAVEEFSPRITRIDLAIDYYDGKVNYHTVEGLYQEGCFAPARGGMPRIQPIAPRRLSKDGMKKADGFSLYIGKRGATKVVRAYEKAHQLANVEKIPSIPFSKWFRVEFEVRAVSCEIPLEVFNDYDAFLTGIYPNLFPVLPPPNHIGDKEFTVRITRLDYHSPAAEVTIEHLKHYAKVSYGPLINVLKHQEKLSDEEIIAALLPDDLGKVPNRLNRQIPR